QAQFAIAHDAPRRNGRSWHTSGHIRTLLLGALEVRLEARHAVLELATLCGAVVEALLHLLERVSNPLLATLLAERESANHEQRRREDPNPDFISGGGRLTQGLFIIAKKSWS